MNRLAIIASLFLLSLLGAWYLFFMPRPTPQALPTATEIPQSPSTAEKSSSTLSTTPLPMKPETPRYGPLKNPDPPKGYAEQRASNLAEIQQIEAKYLSSPEAARSWTTAQWRSAIERLQHDLTLPQFFRWAKTLRQTFVPRQDAWRRLTPQEILDLAHALMALGHTDGGGFLLEWWADPQAWKGAPPAILAALARKTSSMLPTSLFDQDKILPAATMEAIEAACKEQPSLSLETMEDLARTYLALDRPADARRWTERTVAIALADPDKLTTEKAFHYADLAIQTGGLGSGEAWAKALRNLIRRGAFDPNRRQAQTFAGTIRELDDTGGMERAFLDEKGQPRPAVGKVLSHAHALAGTASQWRKTLEEGAKNAADEDRISWRIVDAYARSVEARDTPAEQHQRIAYLLQVKQEAQRPEDAFKVLEERLSIFLEGAKFDLALALLAQSREEFGTGWAARLDAWEERLKTRAYEHDLALTRQKTRNDETRKASLIEYYRSCLQRAKETGNQVEVGRLEGLMAQLEAAK